MKNTNNWVQPLDRPDTLLAIHKVRDQYPAQNRYKDPSVAEHYDERRLRTWRGRLLHKLEIGAYTEAVEQLPRSYKVLDLPCGSGRLLQPLIVHCESVDAVDISAQMLEVARKRYEHVDHVRFTKADGRSLPFEDNEFGCVFSCRLFGHTPPEVRATILREIARVTHDRVALVMYVRSRLITIRKRLQWIVRPPRHPWYPIGSLQELDKLFSTVGLEILNARSLMRGVMESRLVVAQKA